MGTIITLFVFLICQVSATRLVMSGQPGNISYAPTVFFNFKYCSSLIAKSFEINEGLNDCMTTMGQFVLDMQDAIVKDLENATNELYCNGADSIAVRFVAVFEEVSRSTATFPLPLPSGTTSIKKPTFVMVITIKGNIQTDDKSCQHSSWPSIAQLQKVYFSLTQTLTKYHIDRTDILIDRIEEICTAESTNIENFNPQQISFESETALENELELKQKDEKISELEKKIQALTIEQVPSADDDNGSTELSLTSSLTTGQKKPRRKKESKKKLKV